MSGETHSTAVRSQWSSQAQTFEHEIQERLDTVFDPELPGITIRELGILRGVDIDDCAVTVWITPTWSGCPALDEITGNIRKTLSGCGRPVQVRQRLSPAWTSRWLTGSAREKLAQMNITPPVHLSPGGGQSAPLRAHKIIVCPRCGHRHTREVAECGSTACKALYSCPNCRNTFEYFKDI